MNLGERRQTSETAGKYPPQVLAVVERLRAQFPDAGVSLAVGESAFSAPDWMLSMPLRLQSDVVASCVADGLVSAPVREVLDSVCERLTV